MIQQTRGTDNPLHGVACARPSPCLAVGYGGTILRSTDGGSTWRSQTFGTYYTLDGVACARPSPCVAVGVDAVGGTLLQSTDGGTSWRRIRH
jgi:photosystem II stability/assembly factor-like uncharacterized protein